MKTSYSQSRFSGSVSTRLWFSCFLTIVALLLPSVVFTQVADKPGVVPAGTPGGFGVEGEMLANSPATAPFSSASDWFDYNSAAGGVGVLYNSGPDLGKPKMFLLNDYVRTIANQNDPVAPADDDGWVGGAKLNKPYTWGRITHGANNKAEINHGYVLVTKDQDLGEYWVTVGVDRESNNGTNFPGILILQNPPSLPLDQPVTLYGPDNGLTNNDIALILDWSNGGNKPTVRIFKWQVNDFIEIPVANVAADVFVSSNIGTTVALPSGYLVYNGRSSYEPNTFAEFGLNVSGLMNSIGVNCGIFRQVLPLTVTSQEPGAQPKDFVAPVDVYIPLTPTVTCEVTQNVSCYGVSDGSLTATGQDGKPPYQYSLDNVNWQPGNVFSGLGVGTYYVYIKDANNCVGGPSDGCTITGPAPLLAKCSTLPVSCFGGSDGTMMAYEVTGGTPPYKYSINGVDYQDSEIFTGLKAGEHTITVKDSKGCTVPVTCKVEEPPVLTAKCTTTPVSCNGESDGTMTAYDVTGGNGGYTYSIDGGGYQASATFTGLKAGDHTITVKDSKGCTALTTCKITEPDVLTADCSTTPVSCNGGSDGMMMAINVSGGNGDYMFSIDGGGYQVSPTFTGLKAGDHTITVRDGKGCKTTTTCKVVEPPVLTAKCSTTPVSCNGASDGTMTAYDVVGGNGDYQYSIDGGPYQMSPTFTGLKKGMHTITVKDKKDCTVQVTCEVTEPPVVTCSLNTPSSGCNSVENVVTGTVSGGTGAFTCSAVFDAAGVAAGWSVTSCDVSGSTISVKYAAGAAATVKLTVTVTDSKGCWSTCEVTLTCGEGCTPGFWKNATSYWDEYNDPVVVCVRQAVLAKGYTYSGMSGLRSQLFWDIFGIPSNKHRRLADNLTMDGAINLGGGGFEKLARHGVAALLSACGLGGYSYTAGQVLTMVHNGFVDNAAEPVATLLANANDIPKCPLSSDGNIGMNASKAESESMESLPTAFALYDAYPNPFNPSTTIRFDLPEASIVHLVVFNILGQEVATLLNGVVPAGYQSVDWNTDNSGGVSLPSGMYLYRFHAISTVSGTTITETRKVVLIK